MEKAQKKGFNRAFLMYNHPCQASVQMVTRRRKLSQADLVRRVLWQNEGAKERIK
jgi:hypothetical protein